MHPLCLFVLTSACKGEGGDDVVDDSALVNDGDGDGYDAGPDCDDGNPAIHPGATEVCDDADADEDCDGASDDADSGAEGKVPIYVDGDGDGYGSAPAGEACDWGDGLADRNGDCDDAQAQVNPSVEEVCENGIDDNCDGGPAGCGVLGDVTLSADNADAVIVGKDFSGLGNGGMCPLGDIDGDAIDDFVISGNGAGAVDPADKSNGAGGAFLFRGPLAGSVSVATADAIFYSAVADEALGLSCAGPSDFDHDGSPDVTLGSTHCNGFDPPCDGAMRVWFSPVSGVADAASDFEITGDHGAQLGSTLASGDFDGDGSDDAIVTDLNVGAYLFAGPFTEGAVAASPSTASTTFEYETKAGFATIGMMSAGDCDGDGLDDAVFGAPYTGENDGVAWTGLVYVVRGPPAAAVDLASDADVVIAGEAHAELGYALAMEGDANGDGYADLLMGGQGVVGTAYLLHGPLTGDATRLTSPKPVYFGMTVAFGGDMAGTGRDAVAVTQVDWNGTYWFDEVSLFLGPLEAGSTYGVADADAFLAGDPPEVRLGEYMRGGGDPDGDGYAELLVSAGLDQAGGLFAGAVYLVGVGTGGI